MRGFGKRLDEGSLAPQLETLAWHYVKGKPRETVDVNALGPNLDLLEDDELKSLERLLRKAQGLANDDAKRAGRIR